VVPSTPPDEQGLLKFTEPGVELQPGPKPPELKFSLSSTVPDDWPKAESITDCPQVIVVLGAAETFTLHWPKTTAQESSAGKRKISFFIVQVFQC
jgi:hypothetical protein